MKERIIGGFIALSVELTFVVGLLITSYFMISQFAKAGDIVAVVLLIGLELCILAVCGKVAGLLLDYMTEED